MDVKFTKKQKRYILDRFEDITYLETIARSSLTRSLFTSYVEACCHG